MSNVTEKKKKRMTLEEAEAMAFARSDDWGPEGKFGNDPKFMKIKKSDLRSIRIDDILLSDIKETAKNEGYGSYQTFIKEVMRQYVLISKQKQSKDILEEVIVALTKEADEKKKRTRSTSRETLTDLLLKQRAAIDIIILNEKKRKKTARKPAG